MTPRLAGGWIQIGTIASALQQIIEERTQVERTGVQKVSTFKICIQKYFSRHINFEMDVREAGTQSTTSKVGALKFLSRGQSLVFWIKS